MMRFQAHLPLDGASGGLADHLESKISDSQSRQVEQVHERLTCHVNDSSTAHHLGSEQVHEWPARFVIDSLLSQSFTDQMKIFESILPPLSFLYNLLIQSYGCGWPCWSWPRMTSKAITLAMCGAFFSSSCSLFQNICDMFCHIRFLRELPARKPLLHNIMIHEFECKSASCNLVRCT